MKIDYDLVNSHGHGRSVPKEMDLHIIKYIIEKRIEAVTNNPELLTTERWDHSDVFYAARTHLSQNGWNVSVYNGKDNDKEGERRKKFYEKIKDACEKHHRVRRHEIAIFPKDRANMTFKGEDLTVNFHSLRSQMKKGTDVIFVEKQGTVIKLSPFTEKVGLAFIDSEGFGSEYGVALARLCDGQDEAGQIYTDNGNGQYYIPEHKGHLSTITDCDVSGIGIGIKINGARRLGIDLDTIEEINNICGLGLRIADVQEGIQYSPDNTHLKALKNLLDYKGALYDSLTSKQVVHYQNYLTQIHWVDGEQIRFIDWLEHNRIELNSVLAAIKPEAFWEWLKWKLQDTWLDRDYNRAISLEDYYKTPTMKKFEKWYDKHADSIIADKIREKKTELSKTPGFIEDIHAKKEEIQDDIITNTILPDEKIQRIDLALEKIMRDNP